MQKDGPQGKKASKYTGCPHSFVLPGKGQLGTAEGKPAGSFTSREMSRSGEPGILPAVLPGR